MILSWTIVNFLYCAWHLSKSKTFSSNKKKRILRYKDALFVIRSVLKIVFYGKFCKGFIACFYTAARLVCREVVKFAVFIVGMNVCAAQN